MTKRGVIVQEYVDAANWRAWAIGREQRNGFEVRKIVWGRLMARAEKRQDEEIIPAAVMVRQCRVSRWR